MPTKASFLPLVEDALNQAHVFFSQVLGRSNLEEFTLEPSGEALLTDWEARRLEELRDRVTAKLSIYATLASAIDLTPGEQARIDAQLSLRRAQLSRDAREMLRLVDRAVGVRVSDNFRTRSRERLTGTTYLGNGALSK